MNNEIKEILDDLLFTTTLSNVSIKLNKEKLNQLKDYITNLQEENKDLKYSNIYLSKTCDRYKMALEDYKSKIDKAIEYIKSHQKVFALGVNEEVDEFDYMSTSPKALLNILQGEDKEC